MFETTGRSLTKYYVTVTVMLFTAMVICFLSLMTWTIYNNEKIEAITFAKEEVTEYIAILEKNLFYTHNMAKEAIDDSEASLEETLNALRMFSLIKLPNGEVYPLTLVTKDIEKWSKIHIAEKDFSEPVLLSYKVKEQEHHHRLFFVKQDIIKDGIFYGTIYAGKDVTIIVSILKQMTIFSAIIIVCFAFLLFYYGKKFAHKAMLPVEEAILRQKQFITDASHELRTPLSIMLAGTELIKTDTRQPLLQENEKILQDIQEEIRKMSRLVDSLLNLSKVDENDIDIFKEEDVMKIAILALDKLQPLANAKNIKLSLLNSEPVIWRTNNEVLAQILYILLDNAIKYTLNGGQVLVGLKIDNQKERKLVLTVEDTGIGIESDEQKRIFERFYRVDKARSKKESGSGLGLSIVWALLEKCGGTIKVSSVLGKGSLFKVTFPEVGR